MKIMNMMMINVTRFIDDPDRYDNDNDDEVNFGRCNLWKKIISQFLKEFARLATKFRRLALWNIARAPTQDDPARNEIGNMQYQDWFRGCICK